MGKPRGYAFRGTDAMQHTIAIEWPFDEDQKPVSK
jgi:hypothetical protein